MLAMLAACSPPPPANTPEARCQQQEDQDPNVKALLVQAPVEGQKPEFQQQLVMARRKALNDCLTAQGLAPRGGVEPLQGAHYGLGWF
jgi:hypothetical protein